MADPYDQFFGPGGTGTLFPSGPTGPAATPPAGSSSYGNPSAGKGGALANAMWNWAIHYPTVVKRRLTRDDWAKTWGDLGGATYDWGSALNQQGVNVALDPDTWVSTVGQLSSQYKAGGAVGTYYAPDTGQPVQGTFGSLGSDMYKWGQQRLGQGVGRQDWQNAWGDIGGAFYDWAAASGGFPSDQNAAIERIDYLANTYEPGGQIGFAYKAVPNAQQEYQDWYKGYQEKQAEANKAFQDAQIAYQQGNLTLGNQQLALAQKAQADANTLAQQQLSQQGQQFNTQQSGYIGGQKTVDRERMEADITATQDRIRIAEQQGNAQLALDERKRLDALNISLKQMQQQEAQFNTQQTGYIGGAATVDRQRIEADIKATQDRIRIAEQQGNAQLALDERKRLDALQVALGQQGIQEAGVTGYYGNAPTFQRQQFEADLRANPRDWVKSWEYQRGKDPSQAMSVPVPSWLQSVATNQPMPQFQGTSGGLGDFPIKAPDPNQISAKTWNRLNPSEQEGLAGLASSSGFYIPDYIAQMQKSFTKQNTSSTPTWGGF